MKKVWSMIMAVVIAVALAGCGNEPGNAGNAGNAGNERKKTYTFATWAAGTELQEFQQIIDKVNENANGEYTIEVLSIPSDYYVKLSTKIAAKKSPDFFWLTQELISKYADMGALADITAQFEGSSTLNPDMFYEGVLNSAQYKGSYWGIPWIANPLMIYYNKTMFEELKIPCPEATDDWTWEEFIDLCRQFSGKEYKGNTVYGTVIDGWPNIETFIWAGGGDIIGSDNTTIVLDSKEAKQGMHYLQTIVAEGLSPRYAEVSSLGDRNVWYEKQRVAMYFGGIQDNFEAKIAKKSEDEQFEIGYAPLPVCDGGGQWSFDWTASTVMAKSLEGDETAYKAIEAVTQAIFEWKIAPPVKNSIDTVVQIDASKKDALETIAYTLEYARSAHYIPEWSDINDKLWYNLYVQLLSDSDFNYEAKMDEIASYARELISRRK